jgi:hypothetical protein
MKLPQNWWEAGDDTLCSEIRKLNSIWNGDELLQRWNESVIVHIYKKGNEADSSHYIGISVNNYIQNFILYSYLKLTP